MKKLIFIICFSQFILGQEIILELGSEYEFNDAKIVESNLVSNQNNNDLTVLLSDSKTLYIYEFDSLLNKKNKIITEELPPKFNNLLGHQIFGNEYTIFFTNERKNKIGYKRINFEKQASLSSFPNNFDFKKEVFLQSISYKNQFYILTIKKRTSELFFYKFDENIKYKKYKVDLSSLNYVSQKGFKSTAYDILGSASFKLEKVNTGNPNSIESTAAAFKLYVKDNKFILTFDNNVSYTKVFTIDSQTFKVEENIYYFTGDTNKYQKSNSFLYEDKIFQFCSSNEQMKFTIVELSDKELLKEHLLNKGDTITIKNSPIIIEGGFYDSHRELEDADKFFRKISLSDIGISVYKLHNQYQITLGGKKEFKSGGHSTAGVMGGLGGISLGFGNANHFFNPLGFAYGSYSNTRSTYINCLFDLNFNHIDSDMPDNFFDKINNFKTAFESSSTKKIKMPAGVNKPRPEFISKTKTIKAEALHEYNDYTLFGYFDPEKGVYVLRKFQE